MIPFLRCSVFSCLIALKSADLTCNDRGQSVTSGTSSSCECDQGYYGDSCEYSACKCFQNYF